MPENLSVGLHLYLEGCTSLTELPKNLFVEGDIHLEGCTGLKALPKNLFVEGDIHLEGCTGLKALPEKLAVRGNLHLNRCTSLRTLPENLSVGKSLFLDMCTSLTTLPGNLFVRDSLDLTGCTSLTSLPGKFSVRWSLFLSECTSLRSLPENLAVKNDLYLPGCTGLTELPKNLSVKGSIQLDDCTGLTALPQNLYVGRSLLLEDCTALTTLPENLYVGYDLDLTGCTSLTALPQKLSLGGRLILEDCTSLTALPEWITTLGLIRQHDQETIREVNLVNTGLSDALIDRLRNTQAPGMRFYFSRRAEQPEQQFSNPEQGFAFWRELASSDAKILKLALKHHQAVDLARFLGRLTTTADYKNRATRPVLARRVMEVMSLLAGDKQVRDDALRHIHYALSTCADRVIQTLDDLEALQLLITAETLALESRDSSKLLELGQQMMRLDKVREIARDHMKTLNWVDEVEVELAFLIGVCKHFELPGSTQSMLFRGCARVSDQDINNAVQQISSYCSKDNLGRYLAEWAPWQKFERLKTVPLLYYSSGGNLQTQVQCFV